MFDAVLERAKKLRINKKEHYYEEGERDTEFAYNNAIDDIINLLGGKR